MCWPQRDHPARRLGLPPPSWTPEEKNQLMAEHMKTMQEGMAMMRMMGSDGMADMQGKKPMTGNRGTHRQTIEKRMDMMELMMQMVMDRMPAQ